MIELCRALVGELVSRSIGMELVPSDDEPLISAGLVDSIALLELVEKLAERADIRVEPLDLTLENFDSVARIARFAAERKGHG